MPRFDEVEPPDPELMREAGRVAATTHETLQSMLEEGITPVELEEHATRHIRDCGAEPAFLDLEETSHAMTVSVNDRVIHAPPRSEDEIEEGDIVSIDLGARVDGHYSDTAVTRIVGEPRSPKHERLVERTKSALYAGILKATAGNTLRDIGEAIEQEAGEFGNVTNYAGHFIGREIHLEPRVHNTADQNEAFVLERGMFLAVEPVLTLTEDPDVLEQSPGGPVRTRTGAPGAHFEHTVRVGKDRAEILTAREDEPNTL